MNIDNIVLHVYENSPFIVSCAVSFRHGSAIVHRSAMKDEQTAREWIARQTWTGGLPVKVYHYGK